MAVGGACGHASGPVSGLCGAVHRGGSRFGSRSIDRNPGSESFAARKRGKSLALTCRKLFKTSKPEIINPRKVKRMNKRIPVSICLSVLLTLVLTACAGADEVKLTASDGVAYEYFGNSVSIAGDYAIAGASGVSGSAYIFKRDGTTWAEQAKITASDGAANDRFGHSVSISSDYAIMGASLNDGNSYKSGSAYIFKRDGTIWNEQAKITASDGAAYDGFGGSVSISGDYVTVSASGDDSSGYNSNSGSAYLFKRDGTTWSHQAKITASDRAAGDRFGLVSISDNHVIVGVQGDSDNGDWSGSAYIFKRNGTSWSQQAKITASDGAADDWFGGSVSISGDQVIVGAQGDDDNGDWSGSAYIYDIQTSEPPITGDLNGDDRLTPADAVIALKMAAGSCEPTTAADVSSDGVVNSLDALMILQAAAGLITL